jgi:hypothetical protein
VCLFLLSRRLPISWFTEIPGMDGCKYHLAIFGSVPAKVKALCCFGPILGDSQLNGVWVGLINRSLYIKSCHWQAFSWLCGLCHCQQYHPHGPIVRRG